MSVSRDAATAWWNLAPTCWPSRSSKLASDISPTEHPHPRAAHGRRRRDGPRTPLASSVQGIIVRAVTGDQAEGLQFHVLPTDDPLRALNILREAAGLQPLSEEHDDQGG
jgi:hypothetical protein